MKLRVRGSSIRLRVTRGEVAQLVAGAAVREEVPLGPMPLRYALSVADVPAIAASFAAGSLDVRIPRDLAREWLESEQVGVEAQQPAAGGGSLHVLLEKDFACLKPRAGEDDGDAFPNPDA
jgi:hypothetical protein